ncbi:MAG: transaldolase family protein [Planctomycetota bacterium]|nr:transaldolase family protein [Planctomycetota bacterium]
MTTAPLHDSPLASAVADFCHGQVPDAPQQRESFPSSSLWSAVTATGTSLWLDTGDIDAARSLWVREFVALTTNNTLLNKEVQKGIYDELVPSAARLIQDQGGQARDVVQEVAFALNAVHGLKLVRNFDADVSVELHTAISHDAEASYQYGKRFHAICPERFIVKVPLTPAGLLAARRLSDDGVRLNFTLGFSARQNWLIGALAKPTWVNVFMGRINAFLSDNDLGDGKNAGEKATLASQRGLRRLKNQGGADVRQIGASMRNGDQVHDLLGLDVFTMPTGAAKGFVDLAPDAATISDKTGGDPEVQFAANVDVAGDRLTCFWDIDSQFETAAANAAGLDAESATADDVLSTLADSGAGDLFPQFSTDESERIAGEGKIPIYQSWVERVRAGTCSWDGALTAAALASFTKDQDALDDRIRGLI